MNDKSGRAEPTDPRIEAALGEYLEQIDRGEPVDREKFLARHSVIADELRSFFASEDEVRKLAGAEAPPDLARDSTKSFTGQGQETIVPQAAGQRAAETGAIGLSGQFGRYRIIRALGRGAMGTVYLAEDTQLQRQIAIKTPHFKADPTGEQLERFFREARAAGNLRHPHICPIHDFGQIDGKHFITMAYIEGRPLSAFIRADKPQTERQILIVVRKLALALQEAHDHGIVHRDLKPANIMVDKRGEPIVMDFGLAQQARRNEDVRLTQTGNILGTPAFMSPEQVEGDPAKIGPPTDQYSLGVILSELLTGELPFQGPVHAVMAQILAKDPPRPSQLRPDLDPRIEAVCLTMMAKKATDRFPSMRAVADELATILKTPAAKASSKETLAGDHMRPDVAASDDLPGLTPKTLSAGDLLSLEKLARECYSRRDFEQGSQLIERIPEERRNAALRALLKKSGEKIEKISCLICDMDDAVRRNDRLTALSKADDLLKIKPGHHRAREVQEKYSESHEGGSVWLRPLRHLTQPWNEGGWIPWGVLALVLAVFGVMTAVIVIRLNRSTIAIDIQDPGVEVAVKGTTLTITGPDKQSVKVVPGDQELTISCAGLETRTKSFTIKQGETKAVTVSIVNSQLAAWLADETTAPAPARGEKPTASLPPIFTNSMGMEFVLVPKGKSWLGGGGGHPGNKEVVLEHDFYLGKYEVTQEEWTKVTGFAPSWFSRTGRDKDAVQVISDAELKRFPAENLTRDDAQAFLARLNKREKDAGWVYRLPNVVEWEYACRGGPLSDKFESGYDFYFDKPTNQVLPAQANFGHVDGLRRPRPVGSYLPNRLGLYDMHGNVWEWCDDAGKDTAGAAGWAVRGGSWRLGSELGRAGHLHALRQAFQGGIVGFRVARVRLEQRTVSPSADISKQSDSVTAVTGTTRLLVAPFDETAARIAQEQCADALKTPVQLTNSIGMKLALIPAGEFQMGDEDRGGTRDEEKPQHRVRITKPFYFGVYEVTQGEFEQVMGHNPGFFSALGNGQELVSGKDTSRFPVESVSWYDAIEFCNKLSLSEKWAPYYRMTNVGHKQDGSIQAADVAPTAGNGYRLPTEAEWEYACRTGTETPFHFGSSLNGSKANSDGTRPYGTPKKGPNLRHTTTVGSYNKPNALGLFDMHGNVREWCWDAYDEKYYGQSPGVDPIGPNSGSHRVNRSGSWHGHGVDCRGAHRNNDLPDCRSNRIGFRVARVPLGQ